jgi:general secretion pathway protein G
MRRAGDRKGFSFLEFVVVVAMLAAVGALLMGHVRALQVTAERARMEHVLGVLRTAAAVEFASHVIRGKKEQLARLAGSNPMDRLAETPGNYMGAFDNPDPSEIDGGHWYFDRSRGILVYRVRYPATFATHLPGPPRVRFKLQLVSADGKSSRQSGPDKVELQGLIVAPVEPYRWHQPGRKEEQGRP